MFRALLLSRVDDAVRCELTELEESRLPDAALTVAVEYSSINYKDGLAITNTGPVVRSWPMVPGIDCAGRVLDSTDPRWQTGTAVVLNGWGLGEMHWGGLAARARVSAEWPVALPEAFTTREAMIIGTAGYTAMLSVMALERHGVAPDAGEVLVTGAAGGVGSMAVAILGRLGYRVCAATGRAAEHGYLNSLGAKSIVGREELNQPGKPLARERWAGAIDTVGSHTLANVLAATRYGGTVACCGLAQGGDLPATVMPFILRGVTLAGVDSVLAPAALRTEAWDRLAGILDPELLERMANDADLAAAPEIAGRIVRGQVRGRTVIDVNR